MTATFTSENPEEIRRLAKSTDMAIALWEIRQILFNAGTGKVEYEMDTLISALLEVYEDKGIIISDICT